MQNAGLGEPQVGIKTAGRNYTSLAMQSLYWHPEIYGALLSFSKVYLFGSKTTANGDCSHQIKDACSLKEKL